MIIIDVRNKDEYDSGHIDGAENMDVANMMNGRIPDYTKDTKIILYCISGGRAERAKNILEGAGFTNVQNGGGIHDLREKGY